MNPPLQSLSASFGAGHDGNTSPPVLEMVDGCWQSVAWSWPLWAKSHFKTQVYANLQIPTCHPAPATAQPEAKTTTTNKFLSTGSITGTWGDTKALLGDILAVAETFPTGMSCFSMVQCQTNGADPPECFISLCSCAFHHSRAED